MKYKYVGSGDDPPETTTFYGHRFRLGGPGVEVTDETALAKLKNHPCFEQVKERAKRGKHESASKR